MSVMVVVNVEGGTLEQYDQATNELFGSLQPSELPAGLLSHAAVKTDNGMKVVDIWESQEDFDKFAERLVPALQHAQVPETPPKFYEVHNFLKA